MNSSIATDWNDELGRLDEQGLRRRLRRIDAISGPHVERDGRRLCSFASNNYLGLATHPHLTNAAKEAIDRWGWGAGASRLVCGHLAPHAQLEARLAAFKRSQAALVCPTGYAANLAAIRGLVGREDVVLLDKLNHASLIDGALSSGATVRVFPHRDYARLARLLERTRGARRRLIATDSVFSMDGDVADLPRLVELKRRHDAMLLVDEAHATGIFGARGAGLAEEQGVESEIDVVVGTLSKALGGVGGFIAASTPIIDWIVNTAGPFIYTTAIPAAACAAAIAAIDVIEREPERRRRLLHHAERLRHALLKMGWETRGSSSQIIPLVVGESDAALRISHLLEDAGLLVPAIRPPTVPRGTARLRISLSSEHTPADIDQLLTALGAARQAARHG